jgi:hypothetical protein
MPCDLPAFFSSPDVLSRLQRSLLIYAFAAPLM